MKYFFSVLLVSFILSPANSQTLSWAARQGGPADDNATGVAVDASGNVYITGQFTGTADFDPGPATLNLTSAGYNDIYVSKFSPSGSFLWAKQVGGSSWDAASGIALDASGNIYVVGNFSGAVDFDPGAGVNILSSNGGLDAFIFKLDGSGNFIWAKSFGAETDDDRGNAITVDASGNVYATGNFKSTADFDPGPQTFYLTASYIDVYVLKLNSSGALVWAKKMGGSSYDYGNAIAVDASGNVYTTGLFRTLNCDYDPGPGVYYLSTYAENETFISKLDASGNFVWAKQFSTPAFFESSGLGIAVDPSGNVFTAGNFTGTVDFDPGVATFNMTANGLYDGFISKFDAAGNFVWTKQIGGCQIDDYPTAIGLDAAGNIYTTGIFQYQADFDPGPATFELSSAGGTDIFVSKLNSLGNFLSAKRMGGTGADRGYAIAIDALGNLYTAGNFSGTADFDPGNGTLNLVSSGGADIFIQKMSQTESPLSIQWFSFSVQRKDDAVQLNWSAASDQTTIDFIVQHSLDNMIWSNIGSVHASVNSNTINNYSYMHLAPTKGFNYYRIAEKDIDGRISYSEIRSIRFSDVSVPFVIQENPVTSHRLQLRVNEPTVISFYGADGKLLWERKMNGGVNFIDINKLAKGIYFIKAGNFVNKVLLL